MFFNIIYYLPLNRRACYYANKFDFVNTQHLQNCNIQFVNTENNFRSYKNVIDADAILLPLRHGPNFIDLLKHNKALSTTKVCLSE